MTIDDIKTRLDGWRQEKPGQFMARCPNHADEKQSLSVSTGDDGRILLHCLANCDTGDVLGKLGLTFKDLAPSGNGQDGTANNGKRIVATYDYTDAQGELLFQTVRYEPKDFRQRRPDGSGGWTWNLKDTARLLYRLRDLIDADPDDWIVVVEGEKDCDRLAALGIAATTCPMGAGKWSKLSDDSVLAGRRVAIIPDADKAGRDHAADVAQRLHARARELRIVELPGKVKDAADWIQAGGTAEQLLPIIDAAPAYKPMVQGVTVGEFRLTDLGNSERLVHVHGERLRFTDTHAWLAWSGTHWERDTTGLIERLAADTMRALYAQAGKIEDPDQRKRLAGWAVACESRKRLADMIALARSRPEVRISADALDSDPLLLNVQSGTIDLRTGTIRQHAPADLITHCCPVRYDPAATAPLWLAFLNRIMGGDGELIEFLQRAVGYSLTGDVCERVLFVLHGEGRNGKSTLLGVLRELLGTYAQQTPTRTLMCKEHENIPNDVARLRGARFVTAIETTEGQRLDVGLVKAMTGGVDVLTARFMRAEYFEFRPQFKLWLACNHRPRVPDTTDSMWDRIHLIPFTVRIPEDEIDRHLTEKLSAERSGILNWALAGLLAWHAGGLAAPERVRAATRDYRAESDLFGQWLDERCEVVTGARELLKSLYESYSQWCQENGVRFTVTKNRFGRMLLERGFQREKTHGDAQYVGLCVRNLFMGGRLGTIRDFSPLTLTSAPYVRHR